MWNDTSQGTYTILLFIVHEGSNGPTSVGAITGLTMNMDSSVANAEVVDGTGNSARRRRH